MEDNDRIQQDCGNYLKMIRQRANLSQRELGRIARVPQSYISAVETSLTRICCTLGVILVREEWGGVDKPEKNDG